jgi:hypothetical protein
MVNGALEFAVEALHLGHFLTLVYAIGEIEQSGVGRTPSYGLA